MPRFAAYKQFTLWIYQRLGKGNEQVIPSCVLCCIRSVYEERDGTPQKEVAAFGDITTQQTITWSKSAIKKLEQGVKYVQI